MHRGYYLYLWGLFAVPGLLAQDTDYSAAAKSISAVMADPSFVPYTKPNQKLQNLSLSVIRIPQARAAMATMKKRVAEPFVECARIPGKWPRMQPVRPLSTTTTLYRGLASILMWGDKAEDLVSRQLRQGAYQAGNDAERDQPFGRPQLAVMTIGASDAMLWTWYKPGDCQTTINQLQQELDDGGFQIKVNLALYSVAYAGRQAGGATPRESFQVYVLEYATFFAMDPECNGFSWAINPRPWDDKPKLTIELREQLNHMV